MSPYNSSIMQLLADISSKRLTLFSKSFDAFISQKHTHLTLLVTIIYSLV